MGSGKTQVTEWLMAIQGFNVSAGIGLLKGSAVGLLIQSENYSNLALWVDEFREGKVHDDKVAILRDAHNRVPPEKWSPDGVQRRMKTSFVVSGESTSSDAATRSRYPHIQVAANKRLGNHLDWMTEHKECLVVFWRLLMERRAEFVERFRFNLTEWLDAPGLKGMSEREKRVHGIDYAAFMGMESLVAPGGAEVHTGEQLGAFTDFMVEHAKGSAADVSSETNISVFWTDLLTAFKAEEISLNCFRIESTYAAHPPAAENQSGGWQSYRLFMDPDATISALAIYLARQRSAITLKRKDLRDQLSKNAYWIDGQITKRMGTGNECTKAWGFKLDDHPMGYQPATDAEYEHYLLHAVEGDPRKGPLYAIVHALEERERKLAEDTR